MIFLSLKSRLLIKCTINKLGAVLRFWSLRYHNMRTSLNMKGCLKLKLFFIYDQKKRPILRKKTNVKKTGSAFIKN